MNDIQHSTGKIGNKLNSKNKASGDGIVTIPITASRIEISDRLQAVGSFLIRYGLVLVIGWIGAMKFLLGAAIWSLAEALRIKS